jgi:uncharacterized protein (TIGR03437 family)
LSGLGTVNPLISDGSAGPASSQTTNTITADIGGQTATIAYSGLAPDLVGLYQINLTVPTGVATGDNSLDIGGPDSYSSEALISVGGSESTAASPAPRLAVRKLPKSLAHVRRSVPRLVPARLAPARLAPAQ